jgi:hypothetical protein
MGNGHRCHLQPYWYRNTVQFIFGAVEPTVAVTQLARRMGGIRLINSQGRVYHSVVCFTEFFAKNQRDTSQVSLADADGFQAVPSGHKSTFPFA